MHELADAHRRGHVADGVGAVGGDVVEGEWIVRGVLPAGRLFCCVRSAWSGARPARQREHQRAGDGILRPYPAVERVPGRVLLGHIVRRRRPPGGLRACRSRWRPPVRGGRRRERSCRPRPRVAAALLPPPPCEPNRFAGRQRPAAPLGDRPGLRCSACSLTGSAAGAAAHQPRSSGSDSAASCQAATAARASRSGSPSMPTGLERATIARSVFRPATREFGSWSRGPPRSWGSPGRSMRQVRRPGAWPGRRRPGRDAQHALGPRRRCRSTAYRRETIAYSA